jgi:hypothetical protein
MIRLCLFVYTNCTKLFYHITKELKAKNAINLQFGNIIQDKVSKLGYQRNMLNQEAKFISYKINELKKTVSTNSKSELAEQKAQIIKDCEQTLKRPVIDPVNLTDIVGDIYPPYESLEFTLTNFSQLRHKGDPISSPILRVRPSSSFSSLVK